MTTKILNIHGYQGKPHNTAYEALVKLGCDVISLKLNYDGNSPDNIFDELKLKCIENKPNIIVGTSLGGFFAALLAVEMGLPVFLVNPCLMPFLHLPRLGYTHSHELKPYMRLFPKITELESEKVCTIVGLQDEVIDTLDFTKALLYNSRYVEIPQGKHSGSTLPLAEFFAQTLEYVTFKLPQKELAETVFPMDFEED